MEHIVVLRFSAMGDVLMTIPVIDSFARQYPNVRLTVVSRPWAKPIFDLLPSNVSFLGVDFRGAHSGYHGLNLLGRRLLGLQPTHIADLHDVLRTKWLRLRFNMAGLKVSHIKKGRCARKAFINAEKKRQQKTAFEKYADVFRRLGFRDFQIEFHSLYPKGGANLAQFLPSFNIDTRPEPYWIGIAPFAAHEGKVYPLQMMEQVVKRLSECGDTRLFLFGAGNYEKGVLEAWEKRYPHTESIAGKLQNIGEELALISKFKVMLTMDSGNMHLASLAAVPVISVWGATHPLGGFLGYGQKMENVIQRSDLPCRPCSIYGNKPCQFNDYRCMTGIQPEDIVKRVEMKK